MATRGNVVRLKPPALAPATFADACRRWDGADVRGCLDALRSDETPEAAILAGRCYIRLNRAHDALERLGAVPAAALSGDPLRGEHALVTANAHLLLGDAEITDAALSEARAYIYSTRSQLLEAELSAIESVFAWSRHDLKRARATAEFALSIAPTGKWRARSFEALGIIAGAEGKYKVQIDFYERAWAALDEGGEKEPWLRGAFLQVLSGLCKDLYRRDLTQRLSEREQALAWTPDMEYMRFTVLREVGWCHALSGDHLRCFRLLREAAEIAPSLPWRIMTFLERASLAQEMGERLFAGDELQQAKSFANTCDWSQVRGEERLALLRLAEVTSQIDPAEGRALLEIYRKKLPPLAAHMLWANDDRLSAAEAYSFGIVALHSGDVACATDHLTRAFLVWRDIDYVWQALDAAIRLSRLTGADVFTEYARRHAPTFPNTWLARQAEKLRATTATADSSLSG